MVVVGLDVRLQPGERRMNRVGVVSERVIL